MKRPFSLYLLLLLHFILSVSAFIGGIMLVLKKDGSLLGMQKGWLDHSPFANYLVPGLLLIILNGLLPLFTLVGLFFKPQWQFPQALNIYRDTYWAWSYSLYTGFIIITWIIIQMVMTQFFWLQPVVIFIGLLIFICTMSPKVMELFKLK